MDTQAKLLRVIVCFNLPFLLFLKDSIKSDDSAGNVDIARPYEVNLGDIAVLLRTKKVANKQSPIIMYVAADGDKYGKISYSMVNVEIDGKDIYEKIDYLDIATRAVNHLIQHYRVITKTEFINKVTIPHIQFFKLIFIYDDGKIRESNQNRAKGEYHGFGGSLSNEDDEKVRKIITTTAQPNIFELLDINIRYLADSEEWRLVLIESAVAYEAWIYKYLNNKYKKLGLTDAEILQKFITPDNQLPRSIDYISKYLIKDATGFDFKNTPEYLNWKTKVKDLRNDVVHGKRFKVSADEARDAFQTVINCTALLNTK